MNKIEEAFADLYNEKINNAELFDPEDFLEISHYSFIEGVKFAQCWINCEEELPEIKTEPFQVIGKLRINGQYETYFIEHETDTLKKECSHWRYLELK